jgi:hypothetical protein
MSAVAENPALSFSSDLMGMLDSMDDKMSPEGRLVFHCTLDDIGTCEADGVRGCVGYVGQKAQWDRFNSQWDTVLNGFGLDYLHTSKFLHDTNLIGPSKNEGDDLLILEPFINVARRHLLDQNGFGIVVITDCAGYKALTDTEKKVIRPPLRHSFEILIGAACREISPDLSRANPIAFEVDETDVPKTALELLESFIYLKKQNEQYRASLGALCFVDDKMLRAAQAADMLGNLALKGWRNRQTTGHWPPALRAAVSRTDGTLAVKAIIHDGGTLKRIAANRIRYKTKITSISEAQSVGNIEE